MNYAEDRLDRRARGVGIWNEFRQAIQQHDHAVLGRTLRDVGWVRHATYHAGMAWIHHHHQEKNDNNNDNVDDNSDSNTTMIMLVGDYAQMAEFAGYPEIAILSLFHYWQGGSLKQPTTTTTVTMDDDGVDPPSFCDRVGPDWLQQQPPPLGHCGCGANECGRYPCFLPMPASDLEPILQNVGRYTQTCLLARRQMPSAHRVLSILAQRTNRKTKKIQTRQQNNATRTTTSNDNPNDNDDDAIFGDNDNVVPVGLRYWTTHESSSSSSSLLLLQLLMTKVLYLVLPSLALEGIVRLWSTAALHARHMATNYKSHWAYYVLIRSVVLGERIKPHRQKTLPAHHVPVWDIVWGLNARHQEPTTTTRTNKEAPSFWLQWWATDTETRFRDCLGLLSSTTTTTTTTHPPIRSPPSSIVVMGDSHVLSSGWQTIRVPPLGEIRWLIPVAITGLKAWHCRPTTRFFPRSLLTIMLQRLSTNTTRSIFMSAGEIDCREGIGGQVLEGYNDTQTTSALLERHVHNTVEAFVEALVLLPVRVVHVLPVAPHAHRSKRNGKHVGRAVRRRVMALWNDQLRAMLPRGKVVLVDYEKDLVDPGYVLKPIYNADYTHMNSAFLPCLEKALQQCHPDKTMMDDDTL